MRYPEVKNYIRGTFVDCSAPKLDVIAPANGEVISTVPLSTTVELNLAMSAAKEGYKIWSAMTIKNRVQVFYNYRVLLEKNKNSLAETIHHENGKTIGESIAEIDKSIELTEFACSLPQMVPGDILEVSKGVECRTEYNPIGVVASIAPFNFPCMVPHWTIPNALMLGNSMILKPSELTPLSSVKIAEMLKEAGLPDGVFNIVNGGKEIVEAICDHPDIAAVSFVGSTKIAKLVYRRATSSLKRCLALGGAKNHLLVFPDANPDMSAADIAASMSGCAGQRCMAASVMIAIGNVDHIIEKLCNEVRKIQTGVTMGPIITETSLRSLEKYINEAEEKGAKILVDGRNQSVQGKEKGTYLGPTIIDYGRKVELMSAEEVFGPVFEIVHVDSLDEGIEIENNSNYGNAASAFTQSGGIAQAVISRASAGMMGINIGVPVPREPFSFAGWNDSKFGVGDLTGKSSIEFWTKLKKVTTKWNKLEATNWMS